MFDEITMAEHVLSGTCAHCELPLTDYEQQYFRGTYYGKYQVSICETCFHMFRDATDSVWKNIHIRIDSGSEVSV